MGNRSAMYALEFALFFKNFGSLRIVALETFKVQPKILDSHDPLVLDEGPDELPSLRGKDWRTRLNHFD